MLDSPEPSSETVVSAVDASDELVDAVLVLVLPIFVLNTVVGKAVVGSPEPSPSVVLLAVLVAMLEVDGSVVELTRLSLVDTKGVGVL